MGLQNLTQTLIFCADLLHLGTGKTLSLLCSALKWLCDHESSLRTELLDEIKDLEADVRKSEEENSRSTDWLDGQFDLIQKKERLAELKRHLKQLDDGDARIAEMRQMVKKNRDRAKVHKKFPKKTDLAGDKKDDEKVEDNEEIEDSEFIIGDDEDGNEWETGETDEDPKETSNRVKVREEIILV